MKRLILIVAAFIMITSCCDNKTVESKIENVIKESAFKEDCAEDHVLQFVRTAYKFEQYSGMTEYQALCTVVKYDTYFVWETHDKITTKIDSIQQVRYNQALKISRVIFKTKIKQ